MDEIATPQNETDGTRMALAHRHRFVAPLCAGRRVRVFGERSDHHDATPDIVLELEPQTAAGALARLPALISDLPPVGVLVLVLSDRLDTALRSALADRFHTIALYVQRPVSGSLVAASQFADSRVTALADAAPSSRAEAHPPSSTIVVCGPAPVELATGLFESAQPAGAGLFFTAQPVWHGLGQPPPGHSEPPDVARADAVSLVERLMDLDEHLFSLGTEIRALKCQISTTRSAPRSNEATKSRTRTGLDSYPTRFSWPLAENPDTPPDELGLYERRPDDDLVAAGRAGEAFFAAHRLLGDAPDFTGAIAALNAIRPGLNLAQPSDADPPDVSIVIPVHGQFAYTLNCLDGLLRHESARRTEVIVVDDFSPDETGALLPSVDAITLHRAIRNEGFIAACNAGAARARGRIIVLLNNDTRPLPGWLDGLADSFRQFPLAGLVGSKLLYPDGTLQEAGGIVWHDGSAWNFGRGDDPNRPCYCHARQADYISGASIALPAELWRELGGFDRTYSPAYYEDTDIAFRVRALGWEVWFQPVSRLIHYEGRTGGTNLDAGAKSYQAFNRGKLYYRWRETLLRHGSDLSTATAESERQVRKRALLLDDTTPTPLQDAGSNYTLLTMRLFLALGYTLSFVPQDNFLYQHDHTTDLHRMGIACAYAPYELGTDAYLERHGRSFDVVMVSRMQVLESVIDELTEFAPNAPLLFNTHDLNFLRMRRIADLAGDGGMMAAADAMRERELTLMRRVDCIVTPSAFEAEILARELPEVPTRVLPILTDLEGTDVGFDARRDVCFLGGYRHPPNIDAVMFFLERIFPLLKAAEPELRFIVAGANPPPELLALARDDIVVTGMVDDLRDVFDRARVFVCPLRVGAGAKGKIASAMSYGVPIVSTAIGAEGMGLVDGETVLLADEPAAFAVACLRLYRDRPLWEDISTASLAMVARLTSPEARERVFSEAIDAALRHKCGLPVA